MISLIRKSYRGTQQYLTFMGSILSFLFLTFVVAACSKEAPKAEDEPTQSASVGLSLSVPVDEDSFKAFEFQLKNNAKGQLIPMPQLADKQKVLVHTVVKSDGGVVAVKTVKWTYDANTKTLNLKAGDEGNDFPLPDFNNEGGKKWYVTGMIGGELLSADNTVVLTQKRDLKPVANLNDDLGSYDVPYAFPWTLLELNVNGPKEGNSIKYAHIPARARVSFRPMGAFIKLQVGNKQFDSTNPAFTLKSIKVSSNDFGDQGKFLLNTAAVAGKMPEWKSESCGSTAIYNLLGGNPTIAHGATMDKYYYAWVMPRNKDIVRTTVITQGETTGAKSVTNAFFTDYKSKGVNVKDGRVHLLTANVVSPVYLPIEYVAEYNLAGGPSAIEPLGGTTTMDYTTAHLGPLRFSNLQANGQPEPNPHANNRSAHYPWGSVTVRNPSDDLRPQNLMDVDGSTIRLSDKYRIPELDDWWGVMPAPTSGVRNLANIGFNWDGTDNIGQFPNPNAKNIPLRTKCAEHMKVGDPASGVILAQNYSSEYSLPHYKNTSSADGDAILYALRFMKQENCEDIEHRIFIEDPVRFYASAQDNTLACAYRFHRVGSHDTWEDRESMSHQLVVEVVYLGESVRTTPLTTISNEAWWATKRSEGKVYKMILPAIRCLTDVSLLAGRATASNMIEYYYWSTLTPSNNPYSGSRLTMTANFVRGGYFMVNTYKNPVRLFKKDPSK